MKDRQSCHQRAKKVCRAVNLDKLLQSGSTGGESAKLVEDISMSHWSRNYHIQVTYLINSLTHFCRKCWLIWSQGLEIFRRNPSACSESSTQERCLRISHPLVIMKINFSLGQYLGQLLNQRNEKEMKSILDQWLMLHTRLTIRQRAKNSILMYCKKKIVKLKVCNVNL